MRTKFFDKFAWMLLLKVAEYVAFIGMLVVAMFVVTEPGNPGRHLTVGEAALCLVIGLVLTYVWIESILRFRRVDND